MPFTSAFFVSFSSFLIFLFKHKKTRTTTYLVICASNYSFSWRLFQIFVFKKFWTFFFFQQSRYHRGFTRLYLIFYNIFFCNCVTYLNKMPSQSFFKKLIIRIENNFLYTLRRFYEWAHMCFFFPFFFIKKKKNVIIRRNSLPLNPRRLPLFSSNPR